MKKFSFVLLSLIVLFFTACEVQTSETELSGTWKIKSLMANGEDYMYNDHVVVCPEAQYVNFAPDIAKSAIVFGEDNTFELSFVYMDAAGADEPYAEIHKGTYTLSGNTVEFKPTKCTQGGSDIDLCQFTGEIDGNLLRISKSFAAGELWIIPIIDKAVAVNVIFKLRE